MNDECFDLNLDIPQNLYYFIDKQLERGKKSFKIILRSNYSGIGELDNIQFSYSQIGIRFAVKEVNLIETWKLL